MQGLGKYIWQWLSVLLTASGLIFLPANTFKLTSSYYMTALVIAGIIIVVGGAVLFYFIPAAGHWKAGYRRFSTKSFITRRISQIDIDANFVATIHRHSELVFFEKPTPEDFVDMVDTLPGETIDKWSYFSPDSTIADVRQAKANALVVYWKPKESIKLLVPYAHDSRHVSPSLYGKDLFYHSIYFDRDVGVAETTITTKAPLSEVAAFLLPTHIAQVTEARLYKYGLSNARRGCEQPILDSNTKSVSWNLEAPKKGRVYVVLGFYEGEKEKFILSEREKLYRFRVLRFLQKLAQRVIQKVNKTSGALEIQKRLVE